MSKNNTILFIQRYKNFGGAEIQIDKLKTQFIKRYNLKVKTIILEDISSFFILAFIKVVYKILFTQKFDVMFIYQIYFFPLSLISKYLLKKKVIYSERIYSEKNKKRKFIYKYLLSSDLFIVNSEHTKSQYLGMKKNIVFLPNEVFQLDSPEHAPRNLNIKYIYIAIISRLSPEKNIIPTIKKISKELPSAIVTLYYTSFDKSYKDSLMEELKKIKSQIVLKGKDSLSNIYKNNDLVLHPSLFEGTSNVILECGMNKMPILMNNIPQNLILNFHDGCYYNNTTELIYKLQKFQKNNNLDIIVETNYNAASEYLNKNDWFKIDQLIKVIN